MKDLLKKLNDANRIMGSANSTMHNVNSTKRNLNNLSDSNKRSKEQKAAEKALEWKCVCGKKNTTKFCDNCGKVKPACPKCGAADTGSKFCAQCGEPMQASAPASETPAADTPAAKAFCTECGMEITGLKFCSGCGTASLSNS